MLTLISLTFLRYTDKISKDDYLGGLLVTLVEMILSMITAFAMLDYIGA